MSPHFFLRAGRLSENGACNDLALRPEDVNKDRVPDNSRLIRVATLPIVLSARVCTKSATNAAYIASVGGVLPSHSCKIGLIFNIYVEKLSDLGSSTPRPRNITIGIKNAMTIRINNGTTSPKALTLLRNNAWRSFFLRGVPSAAVKGAV